MEAVRAAIAAKCAAAVNAGATSVKIGNVRFDLQNGCVVTVVPTSPILNRTKLQNLGDGVR